MRNETNKIFVYAVFALVVLFVLIIIIKPGNNIDDLQAYVKALPSQPRDYSADAELKHIDLPPSLRYNGNDLSSPFAKATKVKRSDKSSTNQTNSIESYPLSTLKFVGTIQKDGQAFAFLQAPGGLIYQVAVGDHISEKHLQVVNITEDKIVIAEQEMIAGKLVTKRLKSLDLKEQKDEN